MKALMSEKLRKIIDDPQGSRELQRGISELNNKLGSSDETSCISVGVAKYELRFVKRSQQDSQE